MLKFPTSLLVLEGPDLSGKSSLYEYLHRETSFQWNIQDRSALSMLIYAQLYDRDPFYYKQALQKEIYDLNNRMVLCLPTWSEIKRRFRMRGDEIQDENSLKRVYELFYAQFTTLTYLPNVISLTDSSVEKNTENVKGIVNAIENLKLNSIAHFVERFALSCPRNEATPITFQLYDDGEFDQKDSHVLSVKEESAYYNQILTGFIQKIQDEFAGKNEYNLKQSIASRRFVYTDDSCISFIHAIYRDNLLDMHFVLRSTNVREKLKYDLNFLYYLTSMTFDTLGLQCHKDNVRMRFNLNSAHVLL